MPALAQQQSPALRRIARRTVGRKHGPVTRLMSPSDFGQLLKPFVFLDYFDFEGQPFVGELHPHSGIATLSYLIDGRMDLVDPDGHTAVLPKGGVEWMQAGRGMWHGGSVGDEQGNRVRGFQLWVALPPEHELGPTSAVFQPGEDIATSGPVRVLLGSHGGAESAIAAPSPMNYLAVSLKAGERWLYLPPGEHTVLWVATAEDGLLANGEALQPQELVAFEQSNLAVEFEARSDTQFVLGSAVPHPHELVTGYYSVHTSRAALREGEARIQELGARLRRG
ncbi:pirin family protein [Telluria beijingensis]|uniref:pirin family protein n=1 Tax=Telluria beijingensis TaxID=3068633 RepID=UPI00279636BB|nr:pirin family protein [Massilia sp. REN29]